MYTAACLIVATLSVSGFYLALKEEATVMWRGYEDRTLIERAMNLMLFSTTPVIFATAIALFALNV